MTIVLVAVLAATAVPRLRDLGSVDARGFRDETLAAVRYARRLAVATGCDVQVSIDAGGYALASRGASCDSGAFSSPVDHPARPGAFAGAAPMGVGVAAALVRFDRIGRPRDGADAALGAALGITIGPHTITVEPETGYVRAS